VTVYFPEATKSLGNTALIVVQDIADMSAPDLDSEIGAGTSVAAQCFLYADMVATGDTNKGTAPTRACEQSEREEFGRTKYAITDIQYVHDPQGDDAAADNALRAALPPGSEVFLVERQGPNSRTTALADGDLVNIHHVRVGPQNRGKTGDGEFDEFSITQAVAYIEDPVYDVVIGAES
jgi:hypothetical protein